MSRSLIIKTLLTLFVVAVLVVVFGAYHSPSMAYFLEEFRFC